MYIPMQEVGLWLLIFGIFGIPNPFKRPTKESMKEGVSKMTKPIEHQRQYASAGRKTASEASKPNPKERPPRRRIKKAIERNTESRGQYGRRTGRS